MFLQFGIINYKLIIPFIIPFFVQIKSYIHRDDKKPYYQFFTNYIGYLLHGIVYLIILKRMKRRKESFSLDEENHEQYIELKDAKMNKVLISKENRKNIGQNPKVFNQIDVEIEKINSKLTKKKYLHNILLALLYLIPMLLDSVCLINDDLKFTSGSAFSLLFCIIPYVVLSRVILGYKIHRHHILSLTIFIICCILIIIIFIVMGIEINIYLLVNIIIIGIIFILYALYNILEKKFFNIYMDSPYHFMFVVGLISLVLILLYETITVLAFGKDNPFNGIFQQIEKNFGENNFYILIFLGDIILSFLFVGGINLTIYFFTPCHIIILEGIRHIISSIFDNSYAEYPLYIQIIVYILFFIIFFASLIYNEIILIKVFDLDKNTAKNIEKRANLDNEIKISVDDIESNRITLNDKITDDK